jgi:hypothetical protein
VNIFLKYSTDRVVINASDSIRLPDTRKGIEMIAQTASMFHATHQGRPAAMGQNMTMGRTCAVQLIDQRTGSAHRINGRPLVMFTRNPAAAVHDLLERRDPAVWEARVSARDVRGRHDPVPAASGPT